MNLERLMEPGVIAVIGVSHSNPFNPANVIYHKNRLRHSADTYPVNPKGGKLFGEPVFSSIAEVPAPVDLAVLAVRAEFVPGVLEECIQAGAGGAIIISGGFSETGHLDLQKRVKDLARGHDFPVIGPNCLGVYSPPQVDAFFLPHERLIEPRKGKISLVSQSGGILVDQMIKLTQEGVGIARAVSMGNKAVIDEVDLLAFFEGDPATEVIGIYTEGFAPGRGREFVDLVRTAKKPVVIQKSGKTPGGARAVSSHTAALAGDYEVFSEAVRQGGAFEARSEAEFVSFCEALSCCRGAEVGNVCIVTASGGHGAIASDECYAAGLKISDVPDLDRAALSEMLSGSIRPIVSLGNPVDLTGSANDNDFLAATSFFIEKDYVDCILLLLLPYLPAITTDIGARVALIARQHDKPVITYMPHVDRYTIFIDGFESNGIPVAHSVEGAVHMVRALMKGGRR
jgi:acyl-CoA synthetase (NDP forming)